AAGRAADVLSPGSHGSTYGGNPLGCATALTVVETLSEQVMPTVKRKGELLCQGLRDALADLPMVTEVRGKGLMVGIQLDRDCPEIVQLARTQGVLVNVTAGSVVRLLPPLVISEQEINTLVTRVVAAVREFARQQEAA